MHFNKPLKCLDQRSSALILESHWPEREGVERGGLTALLKPCRRASSAATLSVGADIKACSISHSSSLSLGRPQLVSFPLKPQWSAPGRPQGTYTSHKSCLCQAKQIFASVWQSRFPERTCTRVHVHPCCSRCWRCQHPVGAFGAG